MRPVNGIPSRFARYDLTDSGLLPSDWIEQIMAVVREQTKPAELRGGVPSSLEPPGTIIEYGLVEGQQVATTLPWLDHLYRGQFLSFASSCYGRELIASNNVINAININVLTRIGSRYELHVDTNPLTALLFVTTHGEEEGGSLIFRGATDQLVCRPKAGHLLLFDAREAPHEVQPLAVETARVSIPMNYFTETALDQRSSDLDDYLYGTAVA